MIIKNWAFFKNAINKARVPSIKTESYYQNKELIEEMLTTPATKQFIQALEYQKMEGYCGATTIRVILRSIPHFDLTNLYEAKAGAMLATKVAKELDNCVNLCQGIKSESKVVYGSEGYESFLNAIKLINNPQYRVSCNFLRSPLFSFASFPLPLDLIMIFAGGHFSPLIGYDEKRDLVAVFDVNHNYSLYLVPSKRLFEAVNTYDRTAKASRGLVVTKLLDIKSPSAY